MFHANAEKKKHLLSTIVLKSALFMTPGRARSSVVFIVHNVNRNNMIISTIGRLKALIADLNDDMPIYGIENNTSPIIFVADYNDIPEEDRPPPALIIESD